MRDVLSVRRFFLLCPRRSVSHPEANRSQGMLPHASPQCSPPLSPRPGTHIALYAQASPVSREVINMGRPFRCPCGASNSVAKGFRRTKTMGKRRIRLCKSCGQKFTPKNQKPVEERVPPSADGDVSPPGPPEPPWKS